ncbi:alpha/beta fold hydrolase [Aquimarina mytili]|uniref:Alpha/beta hydrolase n=1 Tax=Aquimarina mytili TaxID=874423 RepID=A0A936ZVV7_9FLAO|nr:alpha/beta hydrolase [Aquimarina mytili]MBL0682883.1 alpha/beta hydrolase [Aquimarina mytili]
MQTTINNLKIIFFTCVLFSLFSCSKENIKDLSETIFVRHKGADMPAYIYGNGSEKVFLIILHGGPGDTGLGYRGGTIKSEIEKACAVVYFDQRGSGMAQGSYSQNGINIDIMAEDVLALVKVIKHKYGSDSRFFLMGHSWGGTLGTATLLKNQDEFKGWIDVDGVHAPKGLYFEYIDNFKRVASEQIDIGNNIDYWTGATNLVNNVDPNIYDESDFFRMNNEAFEAEDILVGNGVINNEVFDSNTFFRYNFLTALWSRNRTLAILTNQGLWENLSYTSRLSEITIPSLVLWGRYDMIVPPRFAQEAYDNLGSTTKKLVFFEKSGHSPMASEAGLFADEVIEFINENK